MNTQRISVLVIAIVGIYVSLDTWIRFGNQIVGGSAGNGWVTAILFGIAGILAIGGKFNKRFGLPKNITLSVLSSCILAVMIITTIDVGKRVNVNSELFSYAWAFYAVFACAILVSVIGWAMSAINKPTEESFS